MKTKLIACLIIALTSFQFSYSRTEIDFRLVKDSCRTLYFIADVMPKVKGSEHTLADELSSKFGITTGYENGKVTVQLIVDIKGTTEFVMITKSTNEMLNKKVIEVFSTLETQWIPGEQGGKKVRVSIQIETIFKKGSIRHKINGKTLK